MGFGVRRERVGGLGGWVGRWVWLVGDVGCGVWGVRVWGMWGLGMRGWEWREKGKM